MTTRTVQPTGRGFLLLDAHPVGCSRLVQDMWHAAPAADNLVDDNLVDDNPVHGDPAGGSLAGVDRPVALIIGSSAGYGLATTIAGLARYGIRGVGVCFEKAPTPRRTATAGWYRSAGTAQLAEQAGAEMAFINADAFADATKDHVAGVIEQRFGRLDYLIYSVAAPRRTDPDTGATYTSALKPIGETCRTKTLVFDSEGTPDVREVEIVPADDDEIEQTVGVMGGADWARWIDALADRKLLAEGFTTAALTYIGSELTAAIYRQGTIGAAKVHLEDTAGMLTTRLEKTCGGRAVTSVNGAAVTQSSTAIPGIALYVGLLRSVLGDAMQPPVTQSAHLWDQLTGAAPQQIDEAGRIRLDTWELDADIQAAVAKRWQAATNDNIAELADLSWFRDEFHRLYGFAVPGVDYAAEVDTDVPWPDL